MKISNHLSRVLFSCLFSATLLVIGIAASAVKFDEYLSGVVWPEPPVIDPGTATTAPSDAIVLFDGTNLDAFENGEKWEIADGIATVKDSDIRTKQGFGDCQLHVEFATPAEVKGSGQGRGNSGIYLMEKYEVQVLDSFDNKTYFDGQCGAIYKQQPPTVNACRGPGQWQSYDIIFTAPRFNEDGTVKSPAYITAFQNGILIHNHVALKGGTFWDQPPHYEAHAERLPLLIQNHGNPVRYRNIWIRDHHLDALVGTKPEK